MHDQVMNSQDLRMRQHNRTDLLHKFRIRGLPQQWTYGIAQRSNSRIENKKGNQCSAPSIQIHFGNNIDDRADENHSGRDRITQTVQRRRSHGGRINLLSDPAVVQIHVQLDADRTQKHQNLQCSALHILRMQNFPYGGLQKLYAHQQDQKGNDKS